MIFILDFKNHFNVLYLEPEIIFKWLTSNMVKIFFLGRKKRTLIVAKEIVLLLEQPFEYEKETLDCITRMFNCRCRE